MRNCYAQSIMVGNPRVLMQKEDGIIGIMRWGLMRQGYQCWLKYFPGKENVKADFLCRQAHYD